MRVLINAWFFDSESRKRGDSRRAIDDNNNKLPSFCSSIAIALLKYGFVDFCDVVDLHRIRPKKVHFISFQSFRTAPPFSNFEPSSLVQSGSKGFGTHIHLVDDQIQAKFKLGFPDQLFSLKLVFLVFRRKKRNT